MMIAADTISPESVGWHERIPGSVMFILYCFVDCLKQMNRNRNRLWPRRAGTDVVRFEESPSPSLDEQREMDVKVYNDKLGTWDSLTEWEEVQK